MLVLEPLGKDFGADQYQTLLMTCSGLPVLNYKVIYSLWLPLLGLGVNGSGQAAHQGWFPPVPIMGAGQQKAQGTLRSISTSQLPVMLSH